MVLIGGLDSVLGAVIGAFLVTSLPIIVPSFVTTFVGPTTAIRGRRSPRSSTAARGAVQHELTAMHRRTAPQHLPLGAADPGARAARVDVDLMNCEGQISRPEGRTQKGVWNRES
jgi:hypothetical protein